MVTVTITGGTKEERAMISAFVAYDLSLRGVRGTGEATQEAETLEGIPDEEKRWWDQLVDGNGEGEAPSGTLAKITTIYEEGEK